MNLTPRRLVSILLTVFLFPLLLTLPACSGGSDRSTGDTAAPARGDFAGVRLDIVSGSENKGLEPVVQTFARQRGADIEMHYLGSVDIGLELEKGAAMPYDAVWPANSLWIVLGDTQKVVKNDRSIMRSPVIFGVKKSVAERLGWTAGDVLVQDILDAAESGALRFAMTSATQSNSGASAYFGFLHAMAGGPEVLTAENLQDPEVQQNVRRLLRRVDRSSGSSGWLKDMFVQNWTRFDAMVNYEAMVIEANREAMSRGQEPLWAVYPADGLTIADSPLGYVDKGDAGKAKLFQALQDYLLSPQVQDRIGDLGRRTGLLGLDASGADRSAFNPEWGIDLERVISPIPLPGETVIREALDLYQTALRKPSLTVYVLDFSGSMRGDGETQLKEAMSTLLEPERARRYLLQPSAQDIHLVLPFDGLPRDVWSASGNDPQELRQLLFKILESQAGGGTDIYAATSAALQTLGTFEGQMREMFPAIILMSDGKSSDNLDALRQTMEDVPYGYDVPVFSIAFGDADAGQLKAISEMTSARFFDGKTDLVKAFRHAKGYN